MEPNEWFYEGLWREGRDDHKAKLVRTGLAGVAMCYPTAELDGPQYAQMTANERAALHVITQELEPTELHVIFEAARAVLLTPRPPGFLKRYAAVVEKSKAIMERETKRRELT